MIFRAQVMSITIIVILGATAFSNGATLQQPVFGKSLEEVEKIAAKESRLRMISNLFPEEVPQVLRGFYAKYPAIKVEFTRGSGVGYSERILSEALGGLVEYDLIDIANELYPKYLKGGVLAGPFEWRKLFPAITEAQVSSDGNFVGVAYSLRAFVYNPSLVPAERVPKDWPDCLDPYWKGKLVVDTRPNTFATLSKVWGEQKTLEYAERLRNNQPIWKRGQPESLVQIAAGEYPMFCGISYHTVNGALRRDPKAKLAISWPREVPVSVSTTMTVPKGAKSPNAALLLAGWLASPEGQKGYEQIGRASPFAVGSELWKQLQKTNAKTVLRDLGETDSEQTITKKIIALWGFAK
jgi:ABC-type Fe3+ transport system substrate-binding protein